MKIANATDMKQLSEFGQEEFEKTVLEGPLFKGIVRSIEDAALEGRSSWSCKIDDQKLVREAEVIQKTLIEAGYSCELKVEEKRGPFNFPYTDREFVVSW